MSGVYPSLNPDKALIWRIVHRDNLPWILAHGLHAGNSAVQSPDWVHIGNQELTAKRATHPVPLPPGGALNDYVPFYFTPFSPMLKNIHSGWRGITKRDNAEILILVSSLHRLRELGLPFLFTDSHACYKTANFYSDLADLRHIDWQILQNRDFERDQDDLKKFERYQAEALVHRHCPLEALLGIICYDAATEAATRQLLAQQQVQLDVFNRPGWYF